MIASHRLKHLFQTLWNQPHLLSGKGSTHEESFEAFLRRMDWEPHEYTRHPNGSTKWPDFHLHLQTKDTKPIAVELKTSKSNTVCMGGTWPHPECIYLITANQLLYLTKGSLLLPQADRLHYENYRQAVQLVDRVTSNHWSLRARTELRITLDPTKREEWYRTAL